MRIPALLLATLIVSSASASAQGVSAGVKGGANFSTVRFDGESQATRGRWSGVLGGFFVMPLGWSVSLQVEGLYTIKGARLVGPSTGGTTPALLLDYVEVPVLARVSFAAAGTRLFVAGGPAPAYALRARTRTRFEGSTEEIDIIGEMRRFDAGIAGGGGIQFGALVVEGRYTFGLRNIDKDSSHIAHAANRTLSITAGWRFQ